MSREVCLCRFTPPWTVDLPAQWVVDCKAVGDGQAALGYLARYLYRGVIQERDILRCKDGLVTYRWRDAQTGKSVTRTLPGADFLWLLLRHVLPKGLQRARNFGFLHHNSLRALRLLQLTHLTPKPSQAPPAPPPTQPPTRPIWRCACGGVMRIVRRRMRPDQTPPTQRRKPCGRTRRIRRRHQGTEKQTAASTPTRSEPRGSRRWVSSTRH
jgi:Putative transposase